MKHVRAKKHLGQHFLNDPNIARKIAGNLLKTSTHNVLEIGPGMGILSKELMANSDLNVKAIEIDEESIQYLANHFDDLQVIEGDFLKVDLKTIFKNEFSIIGNFPYNISSQILFKVIDNLSQVPQLVGMFQKEVAERVASKHGSKVYGIISVLVQAYFDVEILFNVSEHVFTPPPKVKSSVIRLVRKNHTLNCNEQFFKQVVKAAFGQRRKKLSNALAQFKSKNQPLDESIFNQRAEQLTVDQFVDLTNKLDPS